MIEHRRVEIHNEDQLFEVLAKAVKAELMTEDQAVEAADRALPQLYRGQVVTLNLKYLTLS